jgi:cyclic pyranopterin phosphate synthase
LVPSPLVENGSKPNVRTACPLTDSLKSAGLRTVNVSRHTVDPQLYRRVTGGDIATVLAGINAAIAAGF